MFVKTTKGIYELTPNRKLVDYPIIDNGRTMGKKQKLFDNKCDIFYGDVVAQSNNLGDLIKFQYQVDEDNIVYNIISTRGVDDKDRKMLLIGNHDKIIGLIRIGDDLVKVAEWDNDKGDWKLYER